VILMKSSAGVDSLCSISQTNKALCVTASVCRRPQGMRRLSKIGAEPSSRAASVSMPNEGPVPSTGRSSVYTSGDREGGGGGYSHKAEKLAAQVQELQGQLAGMERERLEKAARVFELEAKLNDQVSANLSVMSVPGPSGTHDCPTGRVHLQAQERSRKCSRDNRCAPRKVQRKTSEAQDRD
jgi:hypothetical protein